ncbi:hypothetical protein FH972_022594 [Carpinus fangiana]|uniref:Uncharacterized protein n=1 Tax=Carpinus fangiana TaxID=176857 RepID=A0A5N6KT11_9ROSI|nr:hypothetical protein FH972_022594 [Carpinus fangiana]
MAAPADAENAHILGHPADDDLLASAQPGNALSQSPASDAKSRKLRLRKARFQARQLPPSAYSTSSSPPSSSSLVDNPHIESQTPVAQLSSSVSGSPHSIQILSNSSLRRKKVQSREAVPGAPLPGPAAADETWLVSQADHDNPSSRRSSIPVKISRPTGAARASYGSRRSVSGGESKYIEHLESQLAAMQTQLQSLTSPSSTRTQSAKLRAINAESIILRQDVADWEQKFNDRLQEQMEQNDLVTASLRGHIRALECIVEESQARTKELVVECELKSKSLDAVESANYELERRVEFLSELLATSPNRVDLHGSDIDSRSMRTRSIPPPRLFSPDRSKRLSIHTNGLPGMTNPERRRDSHASEASSLDQAISTSSDGVVSRGRREESDEPESPTLIESSMSAPRRFSWIKSKGPENNTGPRPARKMRRFYTGAMGPRTLILPVTTHASPVSASAHSPTTPCPPRGHRPNIHSLSELRIPTMTPNSIESHQLHRRSATWDDEDTSIRFGRRFSTAPQPVSAPPSAASYHPERSHHRESGESLGHRVKFSDQPDGRSLFDELGQLQSDNSSDFGSPPPEVAVKHQGSPEDSSLCSSPTNPLPHKFAESPGSKQVTLYAKSPHSRSFVTGSSSIAALVRRPGGVLAILSTLFSRSLSVYTANARNLMNTAWLNTTLSRPVVEFRWWLIRILVGGLRRKGLFDMPLYSSRSAGAGLGLAAAGAGAHMMAPSPSYHGSDAESLSLSSTHVPGPIANAFSNIPRARWVLNDDAHDVHVAAHRQYGPVVRFGPNMVSVSDPAEIQHIYAVTAGFKKSDFYRALSFFVKGKAIPGTFATQDENIHRALRRPIASMYAMTSVKHYEPFVDSTLVALRTQLDKRYVEPGLACDLGQWLHYFAFDVVGELTFSKRLGFLDQATDIDNIIANNWKFFSAQAPITQITWVDNLWVKNPILQRLASVKINPVVAFARKQRAEREEAAKLYGASTERTDFMTRFLDVENKHKETPPWAVNAWATSNVTAGSDSTAILLRTIFYNLLKHPNTLAALRAEIDKNTPAGEPVTWTEAQSLPYLDACIKEGGRIHPPFALPFERVVPQGGTVVCGKFIPEGTLIGMSAWVVHRDQETFGNDVEDWRPERWLECDATKRRQMENALLHFGAGHRACLGRNISYLEMYKLIPTLLKFYNIEFAEKDCPTWHVRNRWFANQSGLNVMLSKRTAPTLVDAA